MKKIIASILAAFFVVLSPFSAYAATTESMMMYSTTDSMMMFSSIFGSDEYAVMPMAEYPVNNISLKSRVGVYNVGSDSFTSSSEYRTATVSSDGKLALYSPSNYYLPANLTNRDYAFSEITFSNINLTYNNSYRFILNNFYMQLKTPNYYQLNNTAFPFLAYIDVTWNGTIKLDSDSSNQFMTHTGYKKRIPLSSVLSSIPDTGFADIDFVLDAALPTETIQVGSSNYHFVSGNISEFSIVQIYPFSTNTWRYWNTITDTSTVLFSSGFSSSATAGQAYLSIISSSSGFGSQTDNIVNSSTNSIVNTLNSSVSNITNQVNQVKTQITQSTNTITTKIDTMANDVKTGLQNVVTSAQQNTQNIINTVTQKINEVKTGITEVKDSILDLPNKIQEMLLGLIVPDSETMADKYSEFSGLLEEKLGVIYQIPMMLFDFFDTIVNAATTPQSTLTLPAFRLPWIDGSQLTIWNSMEYKIIPDGLEVLSDLIRTVTSMTVVVLTFNSVKQAYERFLRS